MIQPIEDTWNELVPVIGDVRSQNIFIWEVKLLWLNRMNDRCADIVLTGLSAGVLQLFYVCLFVCFTKLPFLSVQFGHIQDCVIRENE